MSKPLLLLLLLLLLFRICVADALDSLEWLQRLGGLDAITARADANFETLQSWLDEQDWIENLVASKAHRSNTSVCLKLLKQTL